MYQQKYSSCLQKENNYKFYFFIVTFFLASASFPSFFFLSNYSFVLLPFLWFIIRRKNITIPENKMFIILTIIIVFGTIHVVLGHLTLIGGISFCLKVLLALLSAILMGRNLLPVFIDVMRFFAITSLIIWGAIVLLPNSFNVFYDIATDLPQMISKEWIESTSNEGVSLYIYYLPTSEAASAYTGFIRNSGAFYEPGLFASYLNIALVFSLCINKQLFSKNNIPLILAILSTCSSAGYVSFMLIVMFSVFMQKKLIYKFIIVIAIIYLWQPVMKLDFMADKIQSNYNEATTSSASRFGAMIYHWEKVQLSPLIGYAGGKAPDTEMDRIMGKVERLLSPNGLTLLFYFWGIPLALYFYYLLYDGFRKLVGVNKKGVLIGLFVVILSTAFSQTITLSLFFLTLASLSFTLRDKNYENSSY